MKYDCSWKSRNNIANRFVNHIVVINILIILWKGKVLQTGSFVSWKLSRNCKSVCSFSSPIPSLFLAGHLIPALPADQLSLLFSSYGARRISHCVNFFPFKRLTLAETRVSFFLFLNFEESYSSLSLFLFIHRDDPDAMASGTDLTSWTDLMYQSLVRRDKPFWVLEL